MFFYIVLIQNFNILNIRFSFKKVYLNQFIQELFMLSELRYLMVFIIWFSSQFKGFQTLIYSNSFIVL